MKNFLSLGTTILAGLFLTATVSVASTPGSDNASSGSYSGGWNNGTDGGTPTFGPWTLSTSNTTTLSGTTTTDASSAAGFFIGDSTGPVGSGNGPGTGNINTGANQSFGEYAHYGNAGDGGTISADATRSFDSALSVGQTFSIQIGVNFTNGNKGLDIFDSSNPSDNIFNLNVNGGPDYAVNNVTTGGGSLFGGVYDPQSIFTISLTQTGSGGGNWTVVRSGSAVSTGTANGTYTGDPGSMGLYINNTDPNSLNANNLYANNLSIVPEPATCGLALAGFGLLLGVRKLRKLSA